MEQRKNLIKTNQFCKKIQIIVKKTSKNRHIFQKCKNCKKRAKILQKKMQNFAKKM